MTVDRSRGRWGLGSGQRRAGSGQDCEDWLVRRNGGSPEIEPQGPRTLIGSTPQKGRGRFLEARPLGSGGAMGGSNDGG
jgi:hypothetical protein